MFSEQYEAAAYHTPEQGEVTDPATVGGIENGNTLNNGADTDKKNNENKFGGTKRVIDTINTKEASEKKIDHPTPDEILGQLNSSFLGSVEKPKNSTEGGAQVVEGSAGNLETPTAS